MLLCSLLTAPARAQKDVAGETQMRLMLDELNNLGSVMMIGAHPDDENTALLAYLARGRHVRTAYLSLTRGEGGQNLIGSEQGDELGIIRTQELLAARRIDGARAVFHARHRFRIHENRRRNAGTKWPREKVLGDVVWDIRRFRPDVIILRFSGTPRDGHGQHQASAILGKEAFAAAADPARFPEQLKYVKPWQAQAPDDQSGGLQPRAAKRSGESPGQVGSGSGRVFARAGLFLRRDRGHEPQPASQPGHGHGASARARSINYFVTDRGDKATKDIFENINIAGRGWTAARKCTRLLNQASAAFVPAHPEALLPLLSKARP